MTVSQRLACSLVALAICLCTACDDPPAAPEPTSRPVAVTPEASAKATAKPVWLRGPTGGVSVAPFIVRRLAQPNAQVVVYVGATWCDPCVRFKQALRSGELDREFQGVEFIEFDLDVDRDTLNDAGYGSKMIPLFAIPRADGHASDKRVEGGVNGPAAVGFIAPRLKALLQTKSLP